MSTTTAQVVTNKNAGFIDIPLKVGVKLNYINTENEPISGSKRPEQNQRNESVVLKNYI